MKSKLTWFCKLIFILTLIILTSEAGFYFNHYLKSFGQHFSDQSNSKKISLVVMGDSVSYGYPYFLDKRLQTEMNSKFIVENRARRKFQNKDYKAELLEIINLKRPDYILIMVGKSLDLLDFEQPQNNYLTNFLDSFYTGRLISQIINPALKFFQVIKSYILNNKDEDWNAILGEKKRDTLIDNLKMFDFENQLKTNLDYISLMKKIDSVNKDVDQNVAFLIFKYIYELSDNNFEAAEIDLSSLNLKIVDTALKIKLKLKYYERKSDLKSFENEILKLKLIKGQEVESCYLLSDYFYSQQNNLKALNVLESCESAISNSNEQYLIRMSFLLYEFEKMSKSKLLALKAMAIGEKLNSSSLWKSFLIYSQNLEGGERLAYLKKALILNPNNYSLIEKYIREIQMNKTLVDSENSFISYLATHSIYGVKLKQINYLFKSLNISSDKNSSVNSRKKFGLSVMFHNDDEAMKNYDLIENDLEKLLLNDHDRSLFSEFFELALANNIKIIIMQNPNSSLSSIKGIFEDSANVIYFDSYSYLKRRMKENELGIREIFSDDANHLTNRGNQLLADGLFDLFINQ